jgi:1-deoxy-D-xylulose-5-phosphate reductoisomerase
VLNAANEIAVERFLARRLRFTDIARVIERVLDEVPARAADDLDAVLEADRHARAAARRLADRLEGG